MDTWLELLRRPPGGSLNPAPANHIPDRYFAQGSLPLACLALEVEGMGALSQPLSPTEAAALHELSEPAHFGLRDQTLLDTSVRHTGEVDADLIDLQWQPGAFAALQQEVAHALGVEQLDAWLHTLLIYGPGQFFKPHQDTERLPGMVATLVLVWPSAHIGGELRVQHGKHEGRLVSQHLRANELRWFAFYADCRHEVSPVDEGWRVVLTFDLVLPRQGQCATVAPELQAAVLDGLRLRFEPDASDAHLRPWVLLLDHEYTEHGLSWRLLKGADRWRACALRGAAEALGLTVHLALAELHENWSTEPVFHSRRGRWNDDDDDNDGADDGGDDDEDDSDDVTPVELLDDGILLDFWVDAEDQVGPRRSLAIRLDDTECFIDTSKAHLVNSEYEGYMGNYGNTVDYWYRRAALVIRTPLAEARDLFELDFDAALHNLQQLTSDPTKAPLLGFMVQLATPVLSGKVAREGRDLLDAYAEIAAALPDADAATTLMRPFDPTRLEPRDAAVLARLARQRGTSWMLGLLRTWYDPKADHWGALRTWQPTWSMALDLPRLGPRPLPAFVAAAQQAAWPDELLGELLDACLGALNYFNQAARRAKPVDRAALLAGGLLDVVVELARALMHRTDAGAGANQRADTRERQLKALIDQLLACPRLYPLQVLRPVVGAVGTLADQWPTHPLRSQVIAALQSSLAEPERSADDRSLRGVDWACRCADCTGLITWAESPQPQPLVMAMAEKRRQHVEEQIAAAGAPLTRTTLRQGSPHKLVLGKPGDLLARDQVQREVWARELAALEHS
ncbi:MAG: 2OG-Fe(II) oxygenase [Burkholderiales bacterium]|nr:2OG-Fe(II) oxygenase [Burkholderiales bacterium]